MRARIESSRRIPAPSSRVNALLCDVAAWRLWSPHICSVSPASGTVTTGWRGDVRAWFSPRPVQMVVDDAPPDGGLRWHSRALGHVLRYQNRVEPDGERACRVTFTAEVVGPLGTAATAIARPLSALGQRRRLARLDALARLSERTG